MAVVTAGALLTGCAGDMNKAAVGQGVGMVTGGIVGGAIGEKIGGKGGMIAGILIGSAIGGMIGHEIGHSLSEQDRKIAHQKFALGMSEGAAGQKHSWTTPDRSSVANYTADAPFAQAAKTRLTRASEVEAPSSLDIIATPHRAPKGAEIKAAPNDKGKAVGKLAKGEEIMVVGRVTGQPWMVVSRNNTTLGYVKAASLAEVSKTPASATLIAKASEPAPAASGFVTSEVNINTTCRGLSYEIIKGTNKAEEGKFAGCKQPDGNWLLQQQQQPQMTSAG